MIAIPATLVPRPGRAPGLTIGLVNNMPDAALLATERQFASLLEEAAPGLEVEIQCYALSGVARGERARAAMAGRYRPGEALRTQTPDALIVTGAEPRAARLEDEPFWPALAGLVDWAAATSLPVIWSCMAAHAAVLRLDGVGRRPLSAKLSGVFESEPADDDPLLAGAPARWTSPHSRLNELAEADLARRGYRILTRSPAAGVDAFALGPAGQRFVFLQGHPEYAADTLAREYCRDFGRHLCGERPEAPPVPHGYFDPQTALRLERLARESRGGNPAELAGRFQAALEQARPRRTWRATASALFGAWLGEIAGARHGPHAFALAAQASRATA